MHLGKIKFAKDCILMNDFNESLVMALAESFIP